MGREARDRREHLPRPVQKIELDARHTKVRLASALLFLVVGVGLILYSLVSRPAVRAGWTEIEAAAGEANCSSGFTFLYPLGTTASPAEEQKALAALYTEACEDAYRIFTNDADGEGVGSVRGNGTDDARAADGRDSSDNGVEAADARGDGADRVGANDVSGNVSDNVHSNAADAGGNDADGVEIDDERSSGTGGAGSENVQSSTISGAYNMRFLNDHPNEEVEVDAALYAAFEQIAASGDRSLYLAPVYEIYDGVFHCDDPSQTVDFDPRQNDTLRAWFAKVCAYAADPSQVDLELMGGNRVRLNVSDEYLAFVREEEIGSFIDFYWMKNAFIADYLAGRLMEGGYSVGTLSSFDGFLRNLDAAEDTDYSLGIYDRADIVIRQAAVLHYRGAKSFVCLRNYPLNDAAGQYYCVLPDGEICTPFLDVRDGLCKSAVNGLTAYSKSADCAEILLKMIPIYIAEKLKPEFLKDLAEEGIQSIWCEDAVICHTEEKAELEELYDREDARYAEKFFEMDHL